MLSARPISMNFGERDFLSTKTAGRVLKGRAGLQENALQHGSMTVNAKDKKAVVNTPFRPGTLQHGRLKDASTKLTTTLGVARPLADKTPFPNRQASQLLTPLPRGGKIAKLQLQPLVDAQPLDTQVQTPPLPPSATRRKQRIPRSASKSFETPVTRGDHWNVSDVSIEMAGSSLQEVHEEDGDDLSDLEYMPPKAVELPYEPPFDMPDYKQVGSTLLAIAYSYPVHDPPNYDYEVDVDRLLGDGGWTNSSAIESLKLPELVDDDPFAARQALSSAVKQSLPAMPSKPNGTAPRLRTATRLAPPAPTTRTSRTLMPPPAVPRPTSLLPPSRPAMSTSGSSTSRVGSTNTKRPLTSASTRTTPPVVHSVRRPVSSVALTRPVASRVARSQPIVPTPVTAAGPARRTPAIPSSSRVASTTGVRSRAPISTVRPAPTKASEDMVLKFSASDLQGLDDFQFEV